MNSTSCLFFETNGGTETKLIVMSQNNTYSLILVIHFVHPIISLVCMRVTAIYRLVSAVTAPAELDTPVYTPTPGGGVVQ